MAPLVYLFHIQNTLRDQSSLLPLFLPNLFYGLNPDMYDIIIKHGGEVLGSKNSIEVLCQESYEELGKNHTMVIIPD